MPVGAPRSRITAVLALVAATLVLLLGIATVIAAASGGFAPAASRIPVLQPGQTFHAGGMDIIVRDAQLIDGLRVSGAFPDDGERLLIVRIDVMNVDDEPRATVLSGSLENVRIRGWDDHPSTSRADDGTIAPRLQPRVPAPILLTWTVPADRFRGGQPVVLELQRETVLTSTLASGRYWQPQGVGATVPLTIVDSGKGDR